MMMSSGDGISMVSMDRAFELVDELRERFYSILPVEKIPIKGSFNRRLSSDMVAARRSPGFDMSTVDGYAVNVDDTFPLAIRAEIFAGATIDRPLSKGETAFVATGARLPDGSNAVIKFEDVLIEDGRLSAVMPPAWESVIRAGSDFEPGDVIIKRGSMITPSLIGLVHASGNTEVEVYKKIRVGVIATGDEIKNGMVPDTNTPVICAMLRNWGCEPIEMGIAGDTPEEVRAMFEKSIDLCDVVITVGGVSVGKKDYVPLITGNDRNVLFRGYRVRPGKPLMVSTYKGRPVFSLPGKPAGSFTAMELIVKRFILGRPGGLCVEMPLSSDVEVPGGWDSIVYVRIVDGKVSPIINQDTYPDAKKYNITVMSASPCTIVADGFFTACKDIRAGEIVKINMI